MHSMALVAAATVQVLKAAVCGTCAGLAALVVPGSLCDFAGAGQGRLAIWLVVWKCSAAADVNSKARGLVHFEHGCVWQVGLH
jgi:hypothetical protein